jgi:hypothetical protein
VLATRIPTYAVVPFVLSAAMHERLAFLHLHRLHTLWILFDATLPTPYLTLRGERWILQNGSLYRAKDSQESDDQRSTRSMHSIGTRLIIATFSLLKDVGLSVPFVLHFPLLRYQIVYFSMRSTRPYYKRDKIIASVTRISPLSWAVPCS